MVGLVKCTWVQIFSEKWEADKEVVKASFM